MKTSFILHACYRRNIFWYLRQNVWQLDGEIILSLLYDHPPIILIATDARDFQAARLIFLCLNQSKKNHPSFFFLGFARVSKDFKQHQLRGLNWAKTLESLPLKLKKKIIAIFPKSEAWKLIKRQELRQNTILEVHSEQYYNLIVTYLLKKCMVVQFVFLLGILH